MVSITPTMTRRPDRSMKHDKHTGNKTVGTNAGVEEKISALERRVEALETEKEQYRNRQEKLETRVAEQQEVIDEQAEEIDELREEVERAEASRGHIIDDVIDVEEQLADVEAGSAGSKGGGEASETTIQDADMTPIERLSKMEAEDTGIDVTPSIERAVTIFDHWDEWSDKTPKGRVLKNDLKKLLRTATGEKLAWRQAYRAAEALEELSKGQIQFINHSRHGKMLIQPSAASGDCHPSSAATS